ncbi:MAG: S-methyl-5-thioribose-1-phosphate isomerase [Methanosarcinaceae archaeon]|nr:S-methyl-5-thioribose-1-phosphate isomerase [Methanosarcinaceae archaeon]
MKTIEWDDESNSVKMYDQTYLPVEGKIIECKTVDSLCEAISNLRVRGAPALGAAGAFGIALAAFEFSGNSASELISFMKEKAEQIVKTRPTAVNLERGVIQVLDVCELEGNCVDSIKSLAVFESKKIADEDVLINKKIGEFGQKLFEDGDVVLTHCNAGKMACVDWGTALGVLRSAKEQGKNLSVVSCETRPLNQGSRITAWELLKDGFEVYLITDSTAGFLMRTGYIDKVIVGADRVANDVVYNKIGTYSLAVLARENEIPFYVAAPSSTFDKDAWEGNVEIEMRSPDELKFIGREKTPNAPEDVKVLNLAFDATPMEYITAFITEKGIYEPPFLIEELLLD